MYYYQFKEKERAKSTTKILQSKYFNKFTRRKILGNIFLLSVIWKIKTFSQNGYKIRTNFVHFILEKSLLRTDSQNKDQVVITGKCEFSIWLCNFSRSVLSLDAKVVLLFFSYHIIAARTITTSTSPPTVSKNRKCGPLQIVQQSLQWCDILGIQWKLDVFCFSVVFCLRSSTTI